MPVSRRFMFMIIACFGFLLSGNAYAMRCGTQLVSEGDSKLSVLEKCGKPTWIDHWTEEVVKLPYTDFERRIASLNERWIYNFGPTQFLRIITFRGSQVLNIETGNRGFTQLEGTRICDFNILSLGMTSAEVAAQCGEPDLKEQRYETVTRPIAGGRQHVTVLVNKWTFNLGPTRFLRVLTFHNGDLVDISTAEKGFSE